MNIALWLARAGRSHPAAPAVGYGKRTVMDYGALALRAARIAGALRGSGLAPGERVAIAAKNHPEYLAILFGIWHAGLTAVPANAKLHGAELGYILEHSGARICFASKDLEGEIAAHAPNSLQRLVTIASREYETLLSAEPAPVEPRAGDDLAWVFYTSGTTGKPKGAMLTHRNLAWASHAYAAEVDTVAPGEAIVHAAPLSHGSGMYALPHVGRLGVNVVPESGAFEPEEIFSLFTHWTRPSMFAAPTMIKVCRGCAQSDRSLRRSPGANLRPRRKSDDDHLSLQARNRRPRSSALGRKARLRRPALRLRRGEGGRS